MKAMVLKGKEQASYDEIPTPKCPHEGMLVKVEAVGLCGSDVRTYAFGHNKLKYPAVLGHENAVKIVEIGKNAKCDFKVGDRVIMHPAIACGKCWYCQNGQHSMCMNRPTYGTELQGGMAEFMALPKEGLERGLILKIPDNIKSEEIVVVELLSSIISAQENAQVGLGDSVVIIGSGPIGCLHSEIARLHGAKQIIMADLNPLRLEMCKKFSGTDFIDSSKEDVVERVLELTDGFGADVVIVAAPATQPHQQGLQMLRKQGTLVIFGGLNKENPWTNLDGNLIHYKEITIKGAYGYSYPTFKKAFDIVCKKMLKGDIVTHILPLKDMEKGVDLVKSGQALKVVLKP